jgi:hypothetical protein
MDDILNLYVETIDFNEKLTLREYFANLLSTLWVEGESFSGKRPFGNSGWQYDIYQVLIGCGYIEGTLDESGYVDDVDCEKADKLIIKLIKHCFKI